MDEKTGDKKKENQDYMKVCSYKKVANIPKEV
jgi:hypothetical protein